MKKKIIIILTLFVAVASAQDLNVLIAQTSIALGDEYMKLATTAQSKVKDIIASDIDVVSNESSRQSNEYVQALEEYNFFKDLALQEYKDVFCESDCRSPIPDGGIVFASTYNYLKREAYSKHNLLYSGSNSYGSIGSYAPIYAVNSNFKEHILGRLSRIIETQTLLDSEARSLKEKFNNLQSSYVDLDTEEVVGVEQSILRESNYTLDKQTQITSYQSCIDSNKAQEDFEESELSKSITQLIVMQNNIEDHFSRVFDYTYENAAGSNIEKIQANLGWQEVDVDITSGNKIYISSTGQWNIKGAVDNFNSTHLNVSKEKSPYFFDSFKSIVKTVSLGAFSGISSILSDITPDVDVDRTLLDNLEATNDPAFIKIKEGLDCKGEGYSFSFSDSLSRGVSNGESNGSSAGVSFYGVSFGQSAGKSGGTSEGRSVSTGGTYQLKLNTTAMPLAPVGSLIGTFCANNPANDSTCEPFLIGNSTFLNIAPGDDDDDDGGGTTVPQSAQALSPSSQMLITSKLVGDLGNGKTVNFVASALTNIYPQASDFNLDVSGNLTINIRTSTRPNHLLIGFNSNASQVVKDNFSLILNSGVSSDILNQVSIGSGTSTLTGGFNKKSHEKSNLRLWLRSNDSSNFAGNSGELSVEIRRQDTFASYWDEYYEWFSSDCDEDGGNCGLGYILENIAYIPSPYTVAKATFVKRFPDFPVEVRELILQQINYIVEIYVAQRDILAKELSSELTATKLNACYDQLELTKEQLSNTKDLVATFQRQIQSINTKKSLLRVTRNHYEREFASINTIREKNLERLKRYYSLAINSYNFLYLDNLAVEDESTPYFEGNFYSEKIDQLEDLVFEITTINDLLNPNRTFLVYDLSPEELSKLTDPDFKKREAVIKLDYDQFYCKGFNIENQARVMIEKVGVLLDINPAKEYLFFQNNSKRSSELELTHGLENRFYDFEGAEHEFWMPSQTRNIKAYSSRILVDSNSDYLTLRDSKYFERLSFRKSSFATSWQLALKDPSLLMYEDSDSNFSEPLLEGVKLVFWINSSEVNTGNRLNECIEPAQRLVVSNATSSSLNVSWDFSIDSYDINLLSSFTLYRSTNRSNGFKAIASISREDCSSSSSNYTCDITDSELESGTEYFYQIRAGYSSSINSNTTLNGIPTASESGMTL